MCRMIAYMGRCSLQLEQVIYGTEHSLMAQSLASKENIKASKHLDGFGLGWYPSHPQTEPMSYKSMLPINTDLKAMEICQRNHSSCFLGHVRAATVANSSYHNCHPFQFKQFIFCFNGTLRHFSKLKNDLLQSFSQDIRNKIQGQTDAEYFFWLLMDIKQKNPGVSLSQLCSLGLQHYHTALRKIGKDKISAINFALSDGQQLLVSRFSDLEQKTVSLYSCQNLENLFPYRRKIYGTLVVSEPLTPNLNHWQPVPKNHYIIIDQQGKSHLEAIPLTWMQANESMEKVT
jgi:glutamine amidotransferase